MEHSPLGLPTISATPGVPLQEMWAAPFSSLGSFPLPSF